MREAPKIVPTTRGLAPVAGRVFLAKTMLVFRVPLLV